MSSSRTGKLDRIAARFSAKPTTSALSFAIEQPATGFTWSFNNAQPYFFASITKLYTSAVIMQLNHERALTLDSRVADLLGKDLLRGLNTHGGHDHGHVITVRELLAHTSGIPDYFEQKRPDGHSMLADLLRADIAWTFDDAMETARSQPSRFAPSTPGKAHYSDTNYQLLGRIIEAATSGGYEQAIRRRIIEPLELRDTWLLTPATRGRYDEVAQLLNGRAPLRIPNAIASVGPDGGLVSTAADGLRFLRAFIGGELFPATYLDQMTSTWNRIFSPVEYGVGIMRFALPRRYSPLAPAPPLIGHSGASGSVLFHAPDHDLYISGTVNQFRHRSLPYRLMLRLINQLR
ncbi:serine hydrolase domain-containing protein [Actinomadura rudentiformis]|uniref:Beta-lactamase family protein n=1 Tax=Actinomadura rudentiformis TaxID=359158 RepID=A0A6H9Z7L4_9ACTN|nr:serine hydrolase domain-containing protein [Actinomadura rudentiformis]KAB2352346.1 beta-lactamase family protein [Actinomadura rudentiformis]